MNTSPKGNRIVNEILAKLNIFDGLDDHQRDQIIELTKHSRFEKGQKVIEQNGNTRKLWFILVGQCEVTRRTEKGCQIKLAELGPNMQFGEMSFFHPAPNSADVIALSDMELLSLSREDFDALVEAKNPIAFRLADNALQQIATRLRKTDEWITNLVCNELHKPTPSEWTSFRELIFRSE